MSKPLEADAFWLSYHRSHATVKVENTGLDIFFKLAFLLDKCMHAS